MNPKLHEPKLYGRQTTHYMPRACSCYLSFSQSRLAMTEPILQERDRKSLTSSIEISSGTVRWKKSNASSWSNSPLRGCLMRTRTSNPLIEATSTIAVKTGTVLFSTICSLRYARFMVLISETLKLRNSYRYAFCDLFSKSSFDWGFWVVASYFFDLFFVCFDYEFLEFLSLRTVRKSQFMEENWIRIWIVVVKSFEIHLDLAFWTCFFDLFFVCFDYAL